MTSTLQEQLKRIAAAAGVVNAKQPRGKPSLLFTYQEAADIGIHDIYQVATQGIDQLCRADPRFQIFRKTLFNQVSQSLDRDQQTAEENAKLDASIASFCALLSGYFLFPAAFKTLEYLIRRFKVNEHNVESLMYAALPYHATNDFVRLVQILSLEGTPFQFLTPMQRSGAAMPRSVLVQRCLTDKSLLRFILDMAKLLGNPQTSSKSIMPFYAATLCEIINSKTTIDEDLITTLLPYLSTGLTDNVIPEYHAATCMIVVQLCTRATLSSRFIEGLVIDLCKSTTPTSMYQSLLVLCHVAVTQPHFESFPQSAFKSLAKLPGLVQELQSVASKASVRSQRLLALMCSAAIDVSLLGGANSNKHVDFVIDVIRMVALLSEEVTMTIAQRMVDAAADVDEDSDKEKSVVRILQALDMRYPDATEKVLNTVLRSTHHDGDDEDGDSDDDTAGGKKKKKKAPSATEKAKEHQLHAVLQKAFTGSLRAPLLDAGTTLVVAVDASSATIRIAALKKLDELVEQQQNEEAESVLLSVLPRRLADDNPSVALAALELSSLLRLPSSVLLESFTSMLHAALDMAEKPSTSKTDRPLYRGVAKKVIKLLTGSFIEKYPRSANEAGDVLCSCLVASPHVRSVVHVAVKNGGATGHPLLKSVESIDYDAFFADQLDDDAGNKKGGTKKKGAAAGKKSKATQSSRQHHEDDDDQPTTPGGSMKHNRFRGYSDTQHNHAVLQAIATAILSNNAAKDAAMRLLSSTHPRSLGFIAIACSIAVQMKTNQSAAKKKLAGDILHHYCQSSSLIQVRKIQKQRLKELHLLDSSTSAAMTATESSRPPFSYVVPCSFTNDGMPEDECIVAIAQGVLEMESVVSELVVSCLDGVSVDVVGQLFTSNELKSLFIQACKLSTTNTDLWAPVQKSIVTTISEYCSAVDFLIDIWGCDTSSTTTDGSSGGAVLPCSIQVMSLKLWADFSTIPPKRPSLSSSSSKSGRSSSQGNTTNTTNTNTNNNNAAAIGIYNGVPRLLSMLCHPEKEVRIAALYAVRTISNAVQTWWPSDNSNNDERRAIQSLLTSFDAVRASIGGDSLAAELLLQRTLEHSHSNTINTINTTSGGGGGKSGRRSSSSNNKSNKSPSSEQQRSSGSGGGSRLDISAEDGQLIASFLLHQLPTMHSAPTLPAVPFTLHVVHDIAPPEQLLSAAIALLKSFAINSTSPSSRVLKVLSTDIEKHTAEELCSVINPSILTTILNQHQQQSQNNELISSFVELFTTMLKLSSYHANNTALRSSMIRAMSPSVFASLSSSEDIQREIVVTLMEASLKDEDDVCRGCAHDCLAALSINASLLVPLLSVSTMTSSEGQSASQRRRKNTTTNDNNNTANEEVDGEQFIRCLECLETLQWKDDVEDSMLLVSPLQELLRTLIALNNNGGGDGGQSQDGRGKESTVRAYAMQLAVSVLVSLATQSSRRQSANTTNTTNKSNKARNNNTNTRDNNNDDDVFDFELAVQCAQYAPDAAVRSAALSLVGLLAQSHPHDALEHVLNVVSLVGSASHELIDAHSNAIASQTLAAVAAAWIQSNKKMEELVKAVVDATIKAPAARRIVLLQSVLSSLEYSECMSVMLVELLERQLSIRSSGGNEDWMFDIASALLKQGSLTQQAHAMSHFLFTCLEEKSKKSPSSPLVLLATALVTTRLQTMPEYSNHQDNNEDENDDDNAGDDDNEAMKEKKEKKIEAEQLASAYESLMQRALTHLHYIGAHSAKKQSSSSLSSSSMQLLDKARDVVYELIQSLQRVMSPIAFINGLIGLISDENDAIQRKALHLLHTIVPSVVAQRQQRRSGGDSSGDELAEVVLGALEPIQAILTANAASTTTTTTQKGSRAKSTSTTTTTTTTTVLTRQTALTTLSTLSDAFADSHPQRFIAVVPPVLRLVDGAHQGTVECASALATIASLIRSLKKQYIAVLPATSSAVLAAAMHAVDIIHDNNEDEDNDDNEEQGSALNSARFELAASLSAVLSLIQTLGAFVAPQLNDIFTIVLNPTVLSCSFARCSETASLIRSEIAHEIPMRLLLSPLSSCLDTAAASGADSACAMLSMLRSAVNIMDSAAVASYHEAVFALILRALDLRRRRTVSQSNTPSSNILYIEETKKIEDVAVSVFVELTLKLSESKFKPLFFRLLEWATSTPAAIVDSNNDGDEALSKSTLPRLVAFFSTVNALTEQLRSVFTAYHQTFVEAMVAALEGQDHLASAPHTTQPSKKKRKKSTDTTSSDALPQHLRYLQPLLRLLIIRALHRCFLYDQSGFLDEARFDILLTPIIHQLESSLDEETLHALPSDDVLEATLHTDISPQLDVVSRAIVGCISQMALAAGSNNDVRWRPLNRAVLMVTRSSEVTTRLVALEAAAGLVNVLQEEYLPLLPESLPFLAELLEDDQHVVEARAASVLRVLEELSGEDLKAYLK